MARILTAAALVALSLGVTGCVTAVENKENMLAAAGFKVKLADTADKINGLKALPPHKFVTNNQNGQPVYLYADPTICRCLYYGDQTAYAAYQQMAFDQRLADQRQMTAAMLQDASWNYWGVWGPWY
ncbi:hypothetical protein [Microvirga pudoricolor]|uniref:hypothetical protein n=1 Tax=Microvirga pudoricolor TaxID=2778729 RepID=UPI0019503945|nr:hypothetical protein [Microvirga pudoricolor]MBM6595696.1 hypothetical protein [Microvirga pudoricolor]